MERRNEWTGQVWAIDPGETCGWACWHDGVYAGSGERNWREMLYQIDQLRVNGGLYIVEAFRVLPWMAKRLAMDDLLPVQIIGVIRYLVGDGYLVLQEPSLRLWFMKKDLRQFGIEERPVGRHATDAVMHGLYWWYFGRDPRERRK